MASRSRSVRKILHRIQEYFGLIPISDRPPPEQILDILESISDAFFSLDEQWRFTYVNSQAARVLNRSSPDLLGKNVWEEYPEAVGSQFEQEYRRAIAQQVTVSFEEFYAPLDAWLAVRAYPIEDGLAVYFQDITDQKAEQVERKRTEVALRQSEERYRSLFNSIDEGFCVVEVVFDQATAIDYRFLEVNQIFEQQTGLSQVIGKTIRELVPNIESFWCEIYGEVVRTGEPIRFEDRSEAMDRWFDVYAFRLDPPESCKVAVLFKDITDRKRTEEELRQKNAILSVINQAAPTPIYVKDRAGKIIYANPATLEVLGKPESEVIGKRDRDLYDSPELGAIVSENDQRIMKTGQTEVVEESPDGVRTFLATKAPYYSGSGEVIGLVGISNDITDRVQFERDRESLLQKEQTAREDAEKANRLKDEFLAILSHELRTPLNPILGWTKLLQSGRLDPSRTKEALITIERNAKLQAQLIEDLLDISRIMQGKLSLNREAADFATVTSAAIETIRLAAEAKQIHIDLQADSNLNSVYGDAGRLQQVMWNLLSNAVKFTPEQGQVTIRITQAGRHIQAQVIDTGKGISPEFLPYLFEYFRQEDGSITRKFGGLGLGLAIARQIVEMHGGTIQAESQGENQGAIFTVRLPAFARPVQPILARPTPSTDPASLTGIRALIVDDDTDTRDFLTYLLQMQGAIVTSVDSAFQAISTIEQSAPDILLSDIGMPDMDGYALMQTIRASKHGHTFPAIALTAYAGELDRQQALKVGFVRHITKPIDPEALIAIVRELVSDSSPDHIPSTVKSENDTP